MATLQVGDRIIAMGKHAGTVRFVGTTKFADGEWFGIEIDEKLGKNDGSVQDVQYFKCEPMKGMFVRRTALEPEPASPGSSKRTSKVKRPSVQKIKRKSGSGPSTPSGGSPATGQFPAEEDHSGRSWNKRNSDLGIEAASINVDTQEELIEAVRGCAVEVARLEDMVKGLSFTLDDAAMRETVRNAPAALFSGQEMPDITSDIEALLGDATSRLEQRLQAKINETLEEQLREALGSRMEDLDNADAEEVPEP
jgi:dynactin complex subunit